MARIELRTYIQPGRAEVFVNIRANDDSLETFIAVIDTGGEISLLPEDLLKKIPYRLSEKGKVILEQAGIARQEFEAVEAYIKLYLEDEHGNRSPELEVRAWFADTDRNLLGFEGILDSAVLHIDMLHTRSSYLEFADS
jgi:hypothetical protein